MIEAEKGIFVEIDRRRFLTWLVAAPTLTVAARFVPGVVGPSIAEAETLPAGAADALIRITPDNRVIVRAEKEEMGQGIATSIAMLVAEEIDARLVDVAPDLAPVGNTSGSTSTSSLWAPVRAAAAAARARLVTAAANRWGTDASALETRDTHVIHPDGRTLAYGELAAEAAGVSSPAISSQPKPYGDHRVIGRATGRLDARDIVTGKARYGMDVDVPGALPTVVARPPTIGGTAAAIENEAEVRAMAGVVEVVGIPTGVAISALTFHDALAARDALRVRWNAGTMDAISDAEIDERLALQLPVPSLPLPTELYLEGFFDFAFLSHSPMEVLNATADVQGGKAELWVASQDPPAAAAAVAEALGIDAASVTIHQLAAGGGFGCRLYPESSVEAARISQAIGRPVKVMWTREDDLRHGRMRSASKHQVRILHAAGNVLAWDQQCASVHVDWNGPQAKLLTELGIDPANAAASQIAWRLMTASPYDFGGLATSFLTEVRLPIQTGTWRAVFAGSARTVEEIMVDELAAALGKDPVAVRRARLKSARARAVLDWVVDPANGDWGREMPPGRGQGVAVQEAFGSATACLVEIDATEPSAPRVTKAVIAVDVGRPVNPRGVEAQVMGATMDGIAMILHAGLHVDSGRVREGRLGELGWPRQANAPIEWRIHVMPANGEPGGLGELGVPSAAGAVANAWARATRKKPRRFPLVS